MNDKSNLKKLVKELERMSEPEEMSQRIELCNQALSLVSKDADPYRWAWCKSVMAQSYELNPLGDRSTNLEHAIEALLQALDVYQQVNERCSEGITLGNLGHLYARLGYLEEMKTCFERSLAISREVRDWSMEITCLLDLGDAYIDNLGDPLGAIEYYQQALTVSHERKDARHVGEINLRLGQIYHRMSQMDLAQNYCRQALKTFEERKDDYGTGRALQCLGTLYADQGQLEQAIQYCDRSTEIFRQIGAQRQLGITLGNLGVIYSDLGKVGQATDFFEQALEISREIGDRLNEATWLSNLGKQYLAKGKAKQAIKNYELALTIHCETGYKVGQGYDLHDIGRAYQLLGKKQEALDYYQQALEVHQEIQHRRGEGDTLVSLAALYESLGKIEQAIKCLQNALVIHRQASNPQGEGSALGKLGDLHRSLGKMDQAESYYRECLLVMREHQNKLGEATAMGSLGSIYDGQEKFQQAIDYYQQALDIFRSHGDKANYAVFLANLGGTYRSLSQREQAKAKYEEALKISREIGDKTTESKILFNLGNIYRDLEQVDKIFDCYHLALKLAEDTADVEASWRASFDLADAYSRYRGDHNTALTYYEKAIEKLEGLRSGFREDAYRRDFLRDKARIYLGAVYSACQIDRDVQALKIIERSKTRFLVDVLSRRDSVPLSVPVELRRRYQSIYDKVQQLEQDYQNLIVSEAPETEVLPERVRQLTADEQIRAMQERQGRATVLHRAAREKLKVAQQELATVEEEIHEQNPLFGQTKVAQTVKLADILEILSDQGRNAAVVYLAVMSEGTAAFILANGLAGGMKKAWIPDFDFNALSNLMNQEDKSGQLTGGWLARYLNRAYSPNHFQLWQDELVKTMEYLGEHLWPPIDAVLQELAIDRLILIPHLALHLLPLHTMFLNRDGKRYCLLDRYEVAFVPSATVLEICHQRSQNIKQKSAQDLLFVCNPTGDLPFTRFEASLVDKLFVEKNQNILRLDFNEATRDRLLSVQQDQGYVHFACHGNYNWDNPLDSALYLFADLSADNVVKPYSFSLADIQRELDLRSTRLVVLSACETGITDPRDMVDEYAGLAAGFLIAGTSGVISTLWTVDDMSTAFLMGEFYRRHLINGQDIVGALRNAQLWLRDVTALELNLAEFYEQLYQASDKQDKKSLQLMRHYRANSDTKPFQHPYYWAGYVFTGI